MSSTLVGKLAPNFTAAAVTGDGKIVDKFNFLETTQDKYKILLFYPLNFTFVCPSELIALDNRLSEFKNRNVEVFGVSIDSQFSHHAWRNTPVDAGGIGQIGYTLIADVSHEICKAYGVQHPEAGVALRGTFIIDRKGVVRSQIVNDLALGRNIDELVRLVDALQFHEEHGEVCPAGWSKGKSGMKANSAGVASYLAEHATEL